MLSDSQFILLCAAPLSEIPWDYFFLPKLKQCPMPSIQKAILTRVLHLASVVSKDSDIPSPLRRE